MKFQKVQNLAFAILASASLSGCIVETEGVAPGTAVAQAVPAKACTSPNTKVLDYGLRVGVAATARGVWSDVKYIPSGVSTGTGTATGNVIEYSANLGVAYTDTGAQALKYAYWSAGTFKTETVAGNAVANITYVRLGYLSNAPNTGIPLIFFSNGAINNGQIMMAVRSTASLTEEGTWTVEAIDDNAGSTNRALELSISPIDQVALVYQGVTAPTANNVRFVYCSSNCNSPLSYVPQGTAATSRVDSGATATQIHIGVGWCQMSSGVYNPAVAYGETALIHRFAICNTGVAGNDLSACLTNAGWTRVTAAIAATGASGTVTDLYLDPHILGDVPKIAYKNVGAGSVQTRSTAVGCNSVVAGTALSAVGTAALTGAAIANFATSDMKILKARDYATAVNERFFLVANETTTDIRWAASTTSSFLGAWNGNVTGQIQTVTLNTAGATNVGAALNTATKQLVTSYGTAAGTFNITLGVVDDYSNPGVPNSAANVYYNLPVEEAGHMQLSSAQVQNIAVAATPLNRPAVAWVDFSSGAATTGRLKYAYRDSAASDGTWSTSFVPGVFNVPAPQLPSLAFDHNDRPWIGYWDAQGAVGRFVLATNTRTDGTGAWTSYMFPVAGTHGAVTAQPAGNFSAVAMSYSSGVASPVMIVMDTGTVKSVRSARLNPLTGDWTSVVTLGALGAQGGAFVSADFSTTSNLITVAYQLLTTGSVRVHYTASTNGGDTWPVNGSTPFPVSNLAQGEGTTIRLNRATGKPGIAYYDRANNRLYYARCTANCTGTAAPTFVGTGTAAMTGLGIVGLSAAGNTNLLNAGLTYSDAGDAYIVYNSGQQDLGALRMVDDVGGTMPSGLPSTVVSGSNGGLSNATAANGAIPWGQSVIRMLNGVLMMAYNSPGNYLSVTTCGD